MDAKQRMDHVQVTDNDIQFADDAAMEIGNGRLSASTPPLGDVKVLRNNVYTAGLRPIRQSHGHTIVILFPETMEVAGNVLDRTGGSGLFLFGGKAAAMPASARWPAIWSIPTRSPIRSCTPMTGAASRPGRAARIMSITTSPETRAGIGLELQRQGPQQSPPGMAYYFDHPSKTISLIMSPGARTTIC